MIRQMQLWVHNNYNTIKFWIFVAISGVLIFVIIQQNHRAVELGKTIQHQNEIIHDQTEVIENQTRLIKSNGDKLIRYTECIAKVFISPPSEEKVIEGQILDPATALENCRILADGASSEPIVINSTPTSPAPATSPSSPSPNQNTNQPSQGQGNNSPPEEPPEPPPPTTVFDTVETIVCEPVGIIIRCEDI